MRCRFIHSRGRRKCRCKPARCESQERSKNHAKTGMRKAKRLKANGRIQSAAETVERVLEREPENPHALTFLAKLRRLGAEGQGTEGELLERAAYAHPRNKVVRQAAGVEAHRKGDVQTARRHFASALESDPSDGATRQAWARMEAAQGHDERAESLLLMAGDDSACLMEVAKRREGQGKIRQAARTLARAAKASPGRPRSYQAWAELEWRRRRYKLADWLLTKAIVATDGDAAERSSALCSRGRLRVFQGRVREGKRDIADALRVDKMNRRAWSTLADILLDMERPKAALTACQQAIKTVGEDGHLLQVLGRAKFAKWDTRGAIETLEYLLHHHDPRNAPALNVLGRAREVQGEVDKAKKCFSRGVDLGHAGCHVDLAELESPFDPPKASELFRRADAVSPGRADTLRRWASHERRRKKFGAARLLFRRASSCSDAAERTFLAWGTFEKRCGDLAAAREAYRQGLLKHPRSSPLWIAAGMLEREVEGAEAATTLFRQGVDMCPDDPALWLELAGSLNSMGEPHRARTAFSRGAQIHPHHLALIQAWADFEMDRGNLHLASKLFAASSRMHGGSSSPGGRALETG